MRILARTTNPMVPVPRMVPDLCLHPEASPVHLALLLCCLQSRHLQTWNLTRELEGVMEQDEKGNARIRATKRKVRSPLSQEELEDPEMRRPALTLYSPPGLMVADGASSSNQPMYRNLPDDPKPGGSETAASPPVFTNLNEYYFLDKEEQELGQPQYTMR